MSNNNLLEAYKAYPSVGLLRLFYSIIRAAYVNLLSPTRSALLWSTFEGRKNPKADVEGPYYVVGAPDRSFSHGKAILASLDDLKEGRPYLFTGRLLSKTGRPLSGILVDVWQADSSGDYYFLKYKLRGTCTTDSDGRFELLTIPPGAYGPEKFQRPGHLHITFSDKSGRVDTLTTQAYLCPGNEVMGMGDDFNNFIRTKRPALMVRAFVTSEEGEYSFMNFPTLQKAMADADADELEHLQHFSTRMAWWNEQLASESLKVRLGGHMEYTL